MKQILRLTFISVILTSCGSNNTTQIAENTFVFNEKVYKIIDNEITLLGDLNKDTIREFQVYKPEKRTFEDVSLSFIKNGAYAKLDGLYRGNYLYFNLYILGFHDLKDNYKSGIFTLYFTDEFGFIVHSTQIPTSELTGMLGENNVDIIAYTYNGKTEMSKDIYNALKTYGLSSTVSSKNH